MSRAVLVRQRLLADCPRGGGETAVVNRPDCLRHFSKNASIRSSLHQTHSGMCD